jgi:nucleoid DNA-binding protein
MESLIVAFLALHKKCVLPELGTFTLQRRAAIYTADSGKLSPSAKHVVFSEGRMEQDVPFIGFVASIFNISEMEATEKLKAFVANVKATCKRQNVVLPGLGVFTNAHNGLEFEPCEPIENELVEVNLNAYEELATIPPSVKNTQKRDFWWLYAIVLIIIGLCAIFLQYA